MTKVTYPPEWEEIRKLAADSDYLSIMKYADYVEMDPDKIDSDEEPTLTHEFSVQSFAISALRKFPIDEVTRFLIQKFHGYQDEKQKSDVLESISQHETELANSFLVDTLKEDNPIFTEVIINGIDFADITISRELLELLLNSVSKHEELFEFIGAVFEIAARSDEKLTTELLDKEFEHVTSSGGLDADQGSFLESLVEAAIEMDHRVDLQLLDRLLMNDGNDRNAGLVARLVNTYPESKAKKAFLARLLEDYADSNQVLSELGMGLE